MSVKTALHGEIGLLTLNRPDQFNPIDLEMSEAIAAGIQDLLDEKARVLVINAEGRMFSAGGDIRAFARGLETGLAKALAPTLWSFNSVLARMGDLPIPIICAIEGSCAGGGMGLAFGSDVRVVGESAKFIAAQIRLGATPDGGLSYYLSRALGPVRAFDLILSGGTLTAQDLAEAHLARVVPDGTATEVALELAENYTNIPPVALRRLRGLLDRPGADGLAGQLAHEARVITELWDSPDLAEGITAFMEKRRPRFGAS